MSWNTLRSAIIRTGGISPNPALRRIEAGTRMFAALLVAGMTIAMIYHGTLTALGIPYPWGTFLYVPSDRFNDWFLSIVTAATHDPYFAKGGGAYFPFAYLALRVGDLPSMIASLAVFKAISAILLATGVLLFWRNYFILHVAPRNARGDITILLPLLLIALVNYPLWFALDRGNLDLWIGGMCLIYVAELKRKPSWLGPLALAAAIALKGYPMAFMLLGLRQRRFVESAAILVMAALLTIVALASFKSGIAPSWQAYRDGQYLWWLQAVIGVGTLNFSTDPYNGFWGLAWIALHGYRDFSGAAAHPAAAVQAAAAQATTLPEHAAIAQGALMPAIAHQRIMIANAYIAVTTTLAGISSFFVLSVPTSRWRRVTVIAATAILYPHVASDYKLLMLLPAIFTILAEPEVGKPQARAFWLLALLMVPAAYLVIYGRSRSEDVV